MTSSIYPEPIVLYQKLYLTSKEEALLEKIVKSQKEKGKPKTKIQNPKPKGFSDPVKLSKTENIIAPLIVAGLTNKEIAKKLKKTENTISTMVFRIFEKSGFSGHGNRGAYIEWYKDKYETNT